MLCSNGADRFAGFFVLPKGRHCTQGLFQLKPDILDSGHKQAPFFREIKVTSNESVVFRLTAGRPWLRSSAK